MWNSMCNGTELQFKQMLRMLENIRRPFKASATIKFPVISVAQCTSYIAHSTTKVSCIFNSVYHNANSGSGGDCDHCLGLLHSKFPSNMRPAAVNNNMNRIEFNLNVWLHYARAASTSSVYFINEYFGMRYSCVCSTNLYLVFNTQ